MRNQPDQLNEVLEDFVPLALSILDDADHVSEALRARGNKEARKLMEKTSVLVALFAALIAILGLVPAFPLASGVPITAQSLGVMLCGTILGSKKGGLAALFFVVLTLVGLPLLAGGRGGIGLLAGASAGFIVGFPVAAYITGWLMEKTKSVDILISVLYLP